MQLRHWSKVYWLTRATMPYVAILSGITAGVAYYQTKEVMWLYGIATLTAAVPYTMMMIMPTTK
jgi:hypothetical protein